MCFENIRILKYIQSTIGCVGDMWTYEKGTSNYYQGSGNEY